MINFEGNYETEIRKIRNAVFTKEQRVNSNADFDGEDKNAIQILIKMNDQFAGTGRMLTDGHIGRIAVLKLFRGNGVGQKIIETFIKIAHKKNMKRVYLDSQKHAISFYEKLGFKEYGSFYEEEGIMHIHMEKLNKLKKKDRSHR